MSYNINGDVTSKKGVGIYDYYPSNYTVIDVETTGLSPSYCEIIELSAIKVVENSIVDTFSMLVKPSAPIPAFIENLTGITNEMVSSAPQLDAALSDYLKFLETDIVVGHNVTFDVRFLNAASEKIFDENFHNDYIDTLRISRKLIPNIENYKLSTLAKHFDISQEVSHRALADCETANELFKHLKELNKEKEAVFIELFKNVGNVLNGKTVVFKGATTICSYEAYWDICKKAGGFADWIFYGDKTDYIVFGKHTYAKYLRGDYSEKMTKALDLQKEGRLKILSEENFIRMLGVDIPKTKSISHHNKIDIKSMSAETDEFDETHPLFGKVCVFTGVLDKMPRKEAMQAVLNLGGEIGNGVTKKTNFLILGSNDYCSSIKNGKSNKHKKAEEYKLKGFDIEIIDEDLFYSMLEE